MKEELKTKMRLIQKTGELVLEHQESRLIKDNLITVAAQNIIGIAKEAIEEIEKEEAPERPKES